MKAPLQDVPSLARFTSFATLSDHDLAGLASLMGPIRQIKRGDTMFSEGHSAPGLHLLLSGWTASSVTMADGRRQMIKVHLPGDVLGLPSLAMSVAVDTVCALSPATVSRVSLTSLGRLFSEHGRLAALLFLISQEERVSLIDRLASVGCNAGPGRVASLVLQLYSRAKRFDPKMGSSFDVPLTQHQIGDLIGLAPVHANRSILKLRREGLIIWKRNQVTILNYDGLVKLSGLPERQLARDQAWLPQAG